MYVVRLKDCFTYEVKKADSILIIRNPNMVLRMHKQKNGSDNKPFKGDLFGRNDIGPFKKNLVIPNELANKLMIKEKRGVA